MEEDNKTIFKKYQKYWDVVESALNEGTLSGFKMAVIETEKILDLSFENSRIPGRNMKEKMKYSKSFIKNPEKLQYSRAMYQKIVNEPGFDVSADDTKEIISGYYRAVLDIEKAASRKMGISARLYLFFHRYFPSYGVTLKKAAIAVLIFLFLVFLSTETSTGRSISGMIADFSRFLFYKVLIALIVAGIILAVVLGAFYYWQDRKKHIER